MHDLLYYMFWYYSSAGRSGGGFLHWGHKMFKYCTVEQMFAIRAVMAPRKIAKRQHFQKQTKTNKKLNCISKFYMNNSRVPQEERQPSSFAYYSSYSFHLNSKVCYSSYLFAYSQRYLFYKYLKLTKIFQSWKLGVSVFYAVKSFQCKNKQLTTLFIL